MARMSTCLGVLAGQSSERARVSVPPYHGHGIGNLGDEDAERLHTLLLSQGVGAELLETGFDLGRRQAGEDIGLELGGDLLVGESMRRTAHGLVGLARDMGGLVASPAFGLGHDGREGCGVLWSARKELPKMPKCV
jgi:hypothetical protein